MKTPWGPSQGEATILAPGIVEVMTASHGGIGVSVEAAEALSAEARAQAIFDGIHYWFEEDCDFAIVVHELPQHFTERDQEYVMRSLTRWNATYLEAVAKRTARQLAAPSGSAV